MPRNIIVSGGNGKFLGIDTIPKTICSPGVGLFSGIYELQFSPVPVAGYGTGRVWYKNTSSTAIIKGWWYSEGIWTCSQPNSPVFFSSSSAGRFTFPSPSWGGLYGTRDFYPNACP